MRRSPACGVPIQRQNRPIRAPLCLDASDETDAAGHQADAGKRQRAQMLSTSRGPQRTSSSTKTTASVPGTLPPVVPRLRQPCEGHTVAAQNGCGSVLKSWNPLRRLRRLIDHQHFERPVLLLQQIANGLLQRNPFRFSVGTTTVTPWSDIARSAKGIAGIRQRGIEAMQVRDPR